MTPKSIRKKLFLTHHLIERKREEFEGLMAKIEILEDEVRFAGSTKLVSELKKGLKFRILQRCFVCFE